AVPHPSGQAVAGDRGRAVPALHPVERGAGVRRPDRESTRALHLRGSPAGAIGPRRAAIRSVQTIRHPAADLGAAESQKIRLILLDGGVYRHLLPLISAKMTGLQVLIETLRRGYLPIDVPEQDFRALSSGEGWEDGTPPPEHFSLLVNIQANALPDHGRWDQDRRTRLAAYLQHRDPQGQLAQIRAAVEQLRVALRSEEHTSELQSRE